MHVGTTGSDTDMQGSERCGFGGIRWRYTTVLTGMWLFQLSPLASYGNGFQITFLLPSTLFPVDRPLGVLPHDGLWSVTGCVLQ